jgi:hypothetical protein
MTVSDIIEKLGGRNAVVAYTGWPYTTVDSWRSNEHVPEWRRSKLLELAAKNGVALSTADFPPAPRKAKAA